jgi:hypothetical protein
VARIGERIEEVLGVGRCRAEGIGHARLEKRTNHFFVCVMDHSCGYFLSTSREGQIGYL